MLSSSNTVRRTVYQFVRTLSSTCCKQSPELKVASTENRNMVGPAPGIGRISDGGFTSPDTVSKQTTEVFPKTWPVWDAKCERVTFLNMDCSTMDTTTSLSMFELKVKCDVEQLMPECVYIQQLNRDVYTTKLISLMSKLGYDSHNFLGDQVGQATFYKNQQTRNKDK
ncbi:uncharacterized protein LOC132560488 [Ylistrum balloti]|uniref:uncharacterized protein LOC132560488 n=1 Tax=Ylistrum balloti TaxID=509963 RepID=UPI002905EFA7|nr:uncharacterized protein LOC132560488 [Ylistrum balloti]